MSCFYEAHNLISNTQFGFAKNKYTELSLLDLKEHILQRFGENREVVLGILIDFTQAFDYINHNRLFIKLEKYGFRGPVHPLLTLYLAYRTQYVSVKNHQSSVR